MSHYTIGMLSSYKGLNPAPIDWLWKQAPEPLGVLGNIQMVAPAEKPDFLLLYNYNSFPTAPAPKGWWFQRQRAEAEYQKTRDEFPKLLRGVPKDRIIYQMREPPLDEVVEKHKHIYRGAQAYCGYVTGPDNDAPTPDYMPAIWYVNASFRDLAELPPPPKVKPCSWITSGISRTENHRKRLSFLKQLQASGVEFDLYGRGLPDWANSGGQLQDKLHGMAPYYYNLSIENYADNEWYVSEKLWDALLSWCLPIYYGGSAADKLLPPGSFLRLPDMDEKGIQFIQDITSTPDAWYAAKEAIAEARQIILHKLNLMQWLSDYVERLK